MGRPAPLPARRRTRSPARAERRARGRPRARHRDARRARSAIANGTFGNRPHCIYRGFCLQGCKVNAKASPLVTHLPDAIEHGVEIRADSMAVRVEVDDATGRCTGVTLRPRRRASASSAPPRSPSPATRSRRRGCC